MWRTTTLVLGEEMLYAELQCLPYLYGIRSIDHSMNCPEQNNSVERWHHSFQATVGVFYHSFWRFLDVLKGEEYINRVKIAQALGGHAPLDARRRYADANQRILMIVDNYLHLHRLQYLRSIAHNLGL